MRNQLINCLAGIILLFGWGVIITYNLPSQHDVLFGDETMYLYSGITYTFPPDHLLAQWGSLYAAWYAFLHLFQPDTLALYYLNWQLLITLVGGLLFLYLYLRRSGFAISLFCALCFQFFTLKSLLDPKVSLMTLCVILLGLCVVEAGRWKAQTVMLITAVTALACSYIRPEFYIAFLLASVTTVSMYFFPTTQARNGLWQLIGLGVLVIGTQWTMGNPMTDGSRSFDAYRQHFILNYTAWHQEPNPITIQQQFERFAEIHGPDVNSVSDAVSARPTLAARHFFTNSYNTVLAEVRQIGAIFYQSPLSGILLPGRGLVFGALLVLVILVFVDRPASFHRILQSNQLFTSREIALLILLLPTLVSVILVYPRNHYIFLHGLGLTTIIAFLLKHIQIKQKRSRLFMAGTTLLLIAWLSFQAMMSQKVSPTRITDTIRYIKSLPLTGPVTTLEREWYRVFLYSPQAIPKWIHVESYHRNTDFQRFVKEYDINFILMTQDMQQYFADDTGFATFLRQAASMGFVHFKMPERGSYLLIKRNLVAEKKGVLSL